ncbi:hypothetical protein [Streptomyces sp. BE147]|uniref:helix-turn-helix transcriptional regulator n=1 Tax=unclassified Streptomyces TaxID=2593676 RepID=UPI002E7A7AC7|nr:hypothetical protein [Streptomyces sp. BE147]MEE1737291.1 hypothetical protein [Streptomyces sp. BE147]
MEQRASTADKLHVLVHSGLRDHFDSPPATLSTIRSGLDHVDFVDDACLTAPGTVLCLPVLIPVASEFQAEGLRAVRVRHPLSLLIAVTDDVTGYRTYYAIRSGASFVLNLAIPGESQVDMLYAQLRAHRMTMSAVRLHLAHADHQGHDGHEAHEAHEGHQEHGIPLRAHGDETARDHVPRHAAEHRCPDIGVRHDDERFALDHRPPRPAATVPATTSDTGLLRLLRTPMTVSEIARTYYCSERSMYRRIRKLYDDLGIRSRTELMSLAIGPNPPPRLLLPGPAVGRADDPRDGPCDGPLRSTGAIGRSADSRVD